MGTTKKKSFNSLQHMTWILIYNQSLRKTIRTCLEKADELKMESIAFPALGTGNLGYKHTDVANVLFEEVEAYEKKVKVGTLNRVCCVIYENDSKAVEVCKYIIITTVLNGFSKGKIRRL